MMLKVHCINFCSGDVSTLELLIVRGIWFSDVDIMILRYSLSFVKPF